MDGTMVVLGRGIVKFIISLFVGGGVGLLTFGLTTRDVPDLWQRNYPPWGFSWPWERSLLASRGNDGVGVPRPPSVQGARGEGRFLRRVAPLKRYGRVNDTGERPTIRRTSRLNPGLDDATRLDDGTRRNLSDARAGRSRL